MSEFSESYHLRGSSRRDVIELLRRSKLPGFVFPALDGWVSFVVQGEPFSPNQDLIKANEGLLLRWLYAEDHGWSFDVFNGRKRLIQYECSWEEDIEVKGKVSHRELQAALGAELPGLAGDAGAKILYPASIDEFIDLKPAYAFAVAVGLANYRWLAYEYILQDTERGHPLPAGVQRVGDASQVSRTK